MLVVFVLKMSSVPFTQCLLISFSVLGHFKWNLYQLTAWGTCFCVRCIYTMISNNTNMYYILCAGQNLVALIFPNFWSLSQSLLNNLSFHTGFHSATINYKVPMYKWVCFSGLYFIPFDCSYGKTKLKKLLWIWNTWWDRSCLYSFFEIVLFYIL